MNTSFSQEWQPELQVHSFHYPIVGEEHTQVASERDNDEEMLARESAAKAEGIREGESRAKCEYDKALKQERAAVQNALESFQQERLRYFQEIEAQVLKLSLTIARKVLHREAQVDPLLLSGLVRVALQNLESETRVKLRVSSGQADIWRSELSGKLDSSSVPEIEEDDALMPGHCVIDTELGNSEFGIDTHIEEIEKGLFDLLAKKPGADL